MNKKVITIAVIFLLLIPFRLPISVMFIELISNIANLKGQLSDDILSANVVVTKVIYNLVLSLWSIWSVELLIREIKKRKPKGWDFPEDSRPVYLATLLISILYCAYMIFDGITTYYLYYQLN